MNTMKGLNLDKALDRAKKSKKRRQGLVKKQKVKAMGRRAYDIMKKEEEDKKLSTEQAKKQNAVIQTINMQIEDTKEGSREEEELLKRRNRIMKKQGRY